MNKKKTGKNKKSSRFFARHSVVSTLIIVCFFVYVAYTFVSQQIDINNQKAKIEAINSEIIVAENEKSALQEEMKMVNTPEYIEDYARSELGYAAPGEIVFIDSTVGN